MLKWRKTAIIKKSPFQENIYLFICFLKHALINDILIQFSIRLISTALGNASLRCLKGPNWCMLLSPKITSLDSSMKYKYSCCWKLQLKRSLLLEELTVLPYQSFFLTKTYLVNGDTLYKKKPKCS